MSTIKTESISNLAGDKTVPVDTVVQGSAKAWVNFDASVTAIISSAFNVSSVTDGGVGNFTVNFTDAMPDANFCVLASVNANTEGDGCVRPVGPSNTITSALIRTTLNGSYFDSPNNYISIFT